MARAWALAVALLGALAWWPAPDAQAIEFGAGPVLMLADNVDYDADTDVVTATGNVDITRGDRRLLADSVRYDMRAQSMEAIGNVALLEPSGDTLFADRITLSGDLRTGVIEELRARLAGDARFAAAQGRRIDGTRTELDRAVYSPCELCPGAKAPLWQIAARDVVHDEADQMIRYKHAFFEVYGVPVLYTPYFSHPDPSVERKSGFLSPTFGNDSQLGFTLETPYYFALAPHYDLTLTPIITSQEGPVLAGEYRQRLNRGQFDIGGSITYGTESEDENSDIASDKAVRGHIEGEGQVRLGDSWTTGYELFVASDDTYLERYDFSNESVLENRLFAERIWGRNYAAINGYGFQGLRLRDDQGLIPIVLPLMDLELYSDPMLWGSRFFTDTNVLVLTRTDGLDTRRFSTTNGWQLPVQGLLGDRFDVRLSLRGDFYNIDGDPETFEDNGENNNEARLIPRATVDWSWPWAGQGLGMTQILEPVFTFTAAPYGIDDDAIPNEDSQDLEFDDTNLFEESRFPGLDQVEEGVSLAYGLRFGGFGDRGELYNAVFGQIFRPKADDTFDANSGLDGNFSDYVGRIDIAPTDWLSAQYRFRLDRDTLSPLRNEVRAAVGTSRFRVDASYLSLEDDPAIVEEFDEREEITAGVLIGLTDQLSIRAQTRRDLKEDATIANTYGLIYRNSCLLFVLGAEQRFTENRDADGGTTFSLRLTFRDLGEIGGEISGADRLGL